MRCLAAAVLALTLLAGAGGTTASEDRFAVDELRYAEGRTRAQAAPAKPARAAATWCGTPTQADLAPNIVAGYPVHWIYAIPSDGPDRLTTYASRMQTDAESIDAWWRGQDPTRVLRNDLAPFSCGTQLDLTLVRLSLSGSQLADADIRFGNIANALEGRGFSSRFTKYLVYYDGPVEPDICGQGGSDSSGLGFAMVYVQACVGVPFDTTAAHEVLHTLGAVPSAAPHDCPEPNDGHVCDNPLDMMYPFGDETPITSLPLDFGRDDYYGHSGAWPDVQDSPWLVQLDRQAPLALGVTGPGAVSADVPGLSCAQSCSTTWNAGTTLGLTATPAAGAKLVRWGGGCSGRAACSVVVQPGRTVTALFAPSTFRLTVAVAGQGNVRSSRAGISCRPRCSSPMPSYEPLRLTANAAQGWRFERWSGACRGARPTCTVPMTAATSARASFVRR
jgi:hypothetical protein